MADTKKSTRAQSIRPGPAVDESPVAPQRSREESDTPTKAEPAKKVAPVEKPKTPAWVARSHRARGVKEE